MIDLRLANTPRAHKPESKESARPPCQSDEPLPLGQMAILAKRFRSPPACNQG
jgi:hypothetical protein